MAEADKYLKDLLLRVKEMEDQQKRAKEAALAAHQARLEKEAKKRAEEDAFADAYFTELLARKEEQAAWVAAYKAGEKGYLCCVDCKKVVKDTWDEDDPEYICDDCWEPEYVPPSPKQCEMTHEERLMYDKTYMPGW